MDDLSWSESTWIIDPDQDHVERTHPQWNGKKNATKQGPL